MIRPLLLLPLIAPVFGIQATTTLTLVQNDPPYNRMLITVDPDTGYPFVNIPDSDTAILTGTVTARFDVDPQTHETSELTLSNGRADASTVNFSRSLLGQGYNVTATGLSAAVATKTPPGEVTPATGEFDASKHSFTIDQGTISGTALTNPVNIVLTPQDPFEGSGTGTGHVTLTPTGISGLYQNYAVVVTLPVQTADVFVTGTTSVDVTSSGTLKAAGTLQVPRSEYLAWTIAEGIPGAAPEADGVNNALAWAYGLGAHDDARQWLPVALPNDGFEVRLPPYLTIAPIRVRTSTGLGTWSDLPAGRIWGGLNPLPVDSFGTYEVAPSGAPREFLILEVEP